MWKMMTQILLGESDKPISLEKVFYLSVGKKVTLDLFHPSWYNVHVVKRKLKF